jgi:hypothetical protein
MTNKNNNLKIIKYLVHGLIIALLVRWTIVQKVSLLDILIISLGASSAFILLDLYSPHIIINKCKNNKYNKFDKFNNYVD